MHIPKWLFIVLLVVLLLRIPSFFEPYYYGDEMIYLTLGQGIRQGVPLYSGLHDNKPPLLYLTAAIAGNLFWFKAILTFWLIGTIYVFWKLSEKLFPTKPKVVPWSVGLFALLTTIPLFEGNTVNAELFFIGPVIFAFLILLSEKLTPLNNIIAGALFAVAALFKIPAIFDILGIAAFWLITTPKQFIKKSFLLAIGFLTPIAITFVWYWAHGAFKDYLVAAFLQNFGYVSTWRAAAVKQPFLTKNAPLLIRFGIAVIGSIIIFIKRRKLSCEFILITCWLLFTLFAVTLSERPYPHYFIQSLPPLCLLLGILIADKTKLQTLVIIPLTLAFFVPVYFKFWYYPTSTYYVRFLNLITGRIDRNNYLTSFDKYLPRDYSVANFINLVSGPNDKIFVWGNNSPFFYALTHRLPPIKYTVLYHINDFSSHREVLLGLEKNLPQLIIINPEAPSFFELSSLVKSRYILLNQIESVQIWKQIGNGKIY